MGFKDSARADITRTFLDFDTFGERLTVEGREIVVVIDSDTLQTMQAGQDLAVAESCTLFYARTEDLPKRRIPGSTLIVNGHIRTVDKWTEDMGMSTVVLRESVTG